MEPHECLSAALMLNFGATFLRSIWFYYNRSKLAFTLSLKLITLALPIISSLLVAVNWPFAHHTG
jgi:PII-like signaling protein